MLKLNLILNNLVSSLDHAVQGDTLVHPYHKSDDGQRLRQFDFVVSNPPFNMDFSDTREQIASMPVRFWAGVPNIPNKKLSSMSIYTCFIQHVINSLKDEVGKGAIVVPTGFITSKSGVEGKVLKKIIDDKIVYGFRTINNFVAEISLHSYLYKLGIAETSTKDADLEFVEDSRWYVRTGTLLFQIFGI